MAQYLFTVNRPRSKAERDRKLPEVVAKVRGWSDTHVIVDVFVAGKLVTQYLNRPIERFMVTYAL